MDDRADVLTRDRRSGAPYELGGEFWQRLMRLLQTYLGVDPQQLATVPRVELAHQVAAAVLLADATQPPYRKVGRAFTAAEGIAAPPAGQFARMALAVSSSVNGVALIDWIDVTPATAGRVQIGMVTFPSPIASDPVTFAIEDRPGSPVFSGVNFLAAPLPLRPELIALGVSNAPSVTPASVVWIGGAGPAAVRVTFGDLVIWPGTAVIVQALTAQVALDVAIKGRYFDLAQLGSGQNF